MQSNSIAKTQTVCPTCKVFEGSSGRVAFSREINTIQVFRQAGTGVAQIDASPSELRSLGNNVGLAQSGAQQRRNRRLSYRESQMHLRCSQVSHHPLKAIPWPTRTSPQGLATADRRTKRRRAHPSTGTNESAWPGDARLLSRAGAQPEYLRLQT